MIGCEASCVTDLGAAGADATGDTVVDAPGRLSADRMVDGEGLIGKLEGGLDFLCNLGPVGASSVAGTSLCCLVGSCVGRAA